VALQKIDSKSSQNQKKKKAHKVTLLESRQRAINGLDDEEEENTS